ncbi:MAG: photosystem II reaction center protein Psb28 [Oscillatoria princeps RMCB-10]|nr:photosystem II reaction center protein Psb28 [Oscillatoria princeps RMCB-10]
MAAVSVQFIDGLDEEISEISLRKRRNSSTKIVILIFERLQAMEKGRSFTNRIDTLYFRDEEGEIQVTPSGIKFFFADDDDFSKAECSFEVNSEPAFERVMRFFNRYAEANGFEFQPSANP